MCVYMHLSSTNPLSRVIDSCEWPSGDAGNQTDLPWKSCTCCNPWASLQPQAIVFSLYKWLTTMYVLVLTAACVTSGRLPDLPFPVCNVGSLEVRCAWGMVRASYTFSLIPVVSVLFVNKIQFWPEIFGSLTSVFLAVNKCAGFREMKPQLRRDWLVCRQLWGSFLMDDWC